MLPQTHGKQANLALRPRMRPPWRRWELPVGWLDRPRREIQVFLVKLLEALPTDATSE